MARGGGEREAVARVAVVVVVVIVVVVVFGADEEQADGREGGYRAGCTDARHGFHVLAGRCWRGRRAGEAETVNIVEGACVPEQRRPSSTAHTGKQTQALHGFTSSGRRPDSGVTAGPKTGGQRERRPVALLKHLRLLPTSWRGD